MINTRLCGAALAASVLLSCASPQTLRPEVGDSALAEEQRRQSLYVLERRAAEYERVYSIAERLSRSNVEFCDDTRPALGVRFENQADYARDLRPAARELWGLSDAVSVSWVGEGSPAARAGLRVRDTIVAINGRAIAEHRYASRRAMNTLRDLSDEGDVTIQVKRGAEMVEIAIHPEPNCAYQVVMVDEADVNAFANGRYILLNRGMLRFTENDEELALVLGHELAHNAMGHIEAAQQNAMVGALGGALLDIAAAAAGVNTGGAFTDAGGDIGRMMFSDEFESEADYVGMYFMARAGYEIEGVEGFWRRMSAEHPRSIRFAYTHPNNAARFVGLAATRDEIVGRRRTGGALRPRMRGEPEPVAPVVTPVSADVAAPVEIPVESAPAVEPSALGEPIGAPTAEPSPPASHAISLAPQSP